MVAKHFIHIFDFECGYLLAKIHMVAKQSLKNGFLNSKLSSSKNPYGSKTKALRFRPFEKLSSSKNPYGSKTGIISTFSILKLSSSKNPYGSKTGA